MNKLGIFVFSGTGNTLMCARALGRELEQKGVSIRLLRIEDTEESPGESDPWSCATPSTVSMPPTPCSVSAGTCRPADAGSGS